MKERGITLFSDIGYILVCTVISIQHISAGVQLLL